ISEITKAQLSALRGKGLRKGAASTPVTACSGASAMAPPTPAAGVNRKNAAEAKTPKPGRLDGRSESIAKNPSQRGAEGAGKPRGNQGSRTPQLALSFCEKNYFIFAPNPLGCGPINSGGTLPCTD